MSLKEEINKLKKEKKAIILAHYYTIPEVQEIADFVGDSLALAQKAQSTDADIILFAGVHFMAETAKILNPGKKVLIPDMSASCSLADSCDADELAAFMQKHPGYKLLSYINCSAKVKTLSDIIVTSGNALKIVKALPEDEKIVFAPDRNLGGYINAQTGRQMLLWNGACHVHDAIDTGRIEAMKQAHPEAEVIAHPECRSNVLKTAGFVGSTAAMLKHVAQSNCQEFIVVTEPGILHELHKQNPGKIFHSLNADSSCPCCECEYMKSNSLQNICDCLNTEQPELILDEETIIKAKRPILKMLDMSR